MNRKVDGSRPIRSHSSSTQRTCSVNCRGVGVGEDPVGEARGPTDGRLRSPADQHGDPRRGRRPDAEGRQGVDGAFVGERLAAPRLREDPQDLVHRGATSTSVRTETGELDLGPAEAQTQQQPAVAEQLDGGRIFGQSQRMVQRAPGRRRSRVRCVVVACAIAAATTRSDGMYPSSTKWCSVVQTDVKPSRSASTARRIVSS